MEKMKKLLSILMLFTALIACKQNHKPETKENKVTEVLTNVQSEKEAEITQDTSLRNEQTIQEFLKQLKTALKDNNINYIQNCISFPFEHKSGGELVDSYSSFKQIKANSTLFNKIENANYLEDCNYEIEKVKHYCISYFDDTLDVSFYAIRKNNQFRLVKMETPN